MKLNNKIALFALVVNFHALAADGWKNVAWGASCDDAKAQLENFQSESQNVDAVDLRILAVWGPTCSRPIELRQLHGSVGPYEATLYCKNGAFVGVELTARYDEDFAALKRLLPNKAIATKTTRYHGYTVDFSFTIKRYSESGQTARYSELSTPVRVANDSVYNTELKYLTIQSEAAKTLIHELEECHRLEQATDRQQQSEAQQRRERALQ